MGSSVIHHDDAPLNFLIYLLSYGLVSRSSGGLARLRRGSSAVFCGGLARRLYGVVTGLPAVPLEGLPAILLEDLALILQFQSCPETLFQMSQFINRSGTYVPLHVPLHYTALYADPLTYEIVVAY